MHKADAHKASSILVFYIEIAKAYLPWYLINPTIINNKVAEKHQALCWLLYIQWVPLYFSFLFLFLKLKFSQKF